MRKYWTSDYAVNKGREGIVYQFADGSETEISLAEYLQVNPDKTEVAVPFAFLCMAILPADCHAGVRPFHLSAGEYRGLCAEDEKIFEKFLV